MAEFFGRVLWSVGFLYSGVWQLLNWDLAVTQRASMGMPMATCPYLVGASVFLTLAGSALVILNSLKIGSLLHALHVTMGLLTVLVGTFQGSNMHSAKPGFVNEALQSLSLLAALWLFVGYEKTINKQKYKLEKII